MGVKRMFTSISYALNSRSFMISPELSCIDLNKMPKDRLRWMSDWPMSKINAPCFASISVSAAVSPGLSSPLMLSKMISEFSIRLFSNHRQRYLRKYFYYMLFFYLVEIFFPHGDNTSGHIYRPGTNQDFLFSLHVITRRPVCSAGENLHAITVFIHVGYNVHICFFFFGLRSFKVLRTFSNWSS